MIPIKNIVFDLGGVLIDWNPRYYFRTIISNPDEMEIFLRNVCNGHWNELQDAGRSFADGEDDLIAKHPGYARLIRSYRVGWPQMLGDEISGTVKILEEIHRLSRYRIFALSNWSAETFPYAFSKYKFFNKFEDIMISGVEKLIKPDPRFYKVLIQRHGLIPEYSLFIDDVEKNIKAAKALGFQTIHFTEPIMLRSHLVEMNVLS
jgi:2-haloacid dehalogenase